MTAPLRKVCAAPHCHKAARSQGYCPVHYARWKRTGSTDLKHERGKLCAVVGCRAPHCAKDLCRTHYARMRRTGSTELDTTPKVCSEFGCRYVAKSRGLCARHYSTWCRRAKADGTFVPLKTRKRVA